MELTVRAYADADAAPLASMFNDADAVFGGRGDNTPVDMRTWMGELRDVARDSRVVCAADGTIVACGVASVPPPGGEHCALFGGVRVDWRGRGIGRDLFAWQVSRCEELRREIAPAARWTAQAYVTAGDTSALRLYERAGLTRTRHWYAMTAPTGQPPELPLPEGVVAVPYAPEHRVAVHATVMDSFAGHWGFEYEPIEHWAARAVDSEDFLPDLSRTVHAGEEVVAMLLSYRAAEPDRIHVGSVGTRPGWRRRGLASALLADVLAAAAVAGYTGAGLNVDVGNPTGAAGVYQSVGFSVESEAISYTLRLPASGGQDVAADA